MQAPKFRSTTVLGCVQGGRAALGADGQVTMGDVVIKSKARKIRLLGDGQVLAGFAGAAGDALALLDKLEEQVKRYPGQLRSEERRVGKECELKCRSRWSPYH